MLPAAPGICDHLNCSPWSNALTKSGTTFACLPGPVEPDGVRPDVLVLGKALGGDETDRSRCPSAH
jgi:ornithine--oxo-acid transaminase